MKLFLTMGNSLLQYRLVIGMHVSYLKRREYNESSRGRFWNCLVLLFYLEAIYLPVLKTLVYRYELMQFNRLWVTQVYLYRFYLPELIRLSNDVETNPGPTSDFNKIGPMPSSLFTFSPLSETSQSFLCSKIKLPLVVKHCKKSVKELGKPTQMFRIADDGNCLFRALSYAITGRQRYHANIREKIVDHMKHIDRFLTPYIKTSLNCYLHTTGMAQSGVGGTDIEILVASSLLSTDILVNTKCGHTFKWVKFSRSKLDDQKTENSSSIYLSRSTYNHYDVVIDVSVNETNQHFYSEFSSDTKCFSQDNSSLRKSQKTCTYSSTSEKNSAFDEYCRKKPKLMNNKTDVPINNINHQFCNGSPSHENCKFPPHVTVKNENQSLNASCSMQNQTVRTCLKKNPPKCNFKLDNQSEVSKNCRKKTHGGEAD